MVKALLLLLPFSKRNSSNRIVFSVIVEFNSEWKSKYTTIQKDKYYAPRGSANADNNFEFTSNSVESLLVETLQHELPKEIYDLLEYKTTVKINKVYYGSITVIFTVIGAAYYGISKYKNFIDSCELIKKQIKTLLKERISNKFGGNPFDINVNIEVPSYNSLVPSNELHTKRDGFFYFLLISFLVLSVIIGILVYHSLKLTYFR